MRKQKRTIKERLRIFRLKFRNNWFVSWVASQWIHAIRLFLFASAKRQAKRWYKRTGKRFFVIPISNYKFSVFNNSGRKAYNRRVAKYMRLSYKKLDTIEYWNTGLSKETQPKEIKVEKPKTKKK